MYTRREESSGEVDTSPEVLFELLDDHNRLSMHMTRRSWKMLWGQMNILPDAQHGRAAGSHIVLSGRVLGLSLFLDEVVTVREPPLRKRWETVGEPRLLVIGAYAMEFEITPNQKASYLTVRIEYCLPGTAPCFGAHFRQALCELVHQKNGSRRTAGLRQTIEGSSGDTFHPRCVNISLRLCIARIVLPDLSRSYRACFW